MVWRQMVADICELPVVVPTISEAAALGGALQAWWALRKEQGENITLEEIVAEHVLLDEKSACLPIDENIPRYRKAYGTYCTYVSAVKPLFA